MNVQEIKELIETRLNDSEFYDEARNIFPDFFEMDLIVLGNAYGLNNDQAKRIFDHVWEAEQSEGYREVYNDFVCDVEFFFEILKLSGNNLLLDELRTRGIGGDRK